jgi:hypothetical protein
MGGSIIAMPLPLVEIGVAFAETECCDALSDSGFRHNLSVLTSFLFKEFMF